MYSRQTTMPRHAVAPIKHPPPQTGGLLHQHHGRVIYSLPRHAITCCPILSTTTHPHCAGRVPTTHTHPQTTPSHSPLASTLVVATNHARVCSGCCTGPVVSFQGRVAPQLLTLGACGTLPAAASAAADKVATLAALTGAACARPAPSSAAQTRWSRVQTRPAHLCSRPRRQTGARQPS